MQIYYSQLNNLPVYTESQQLIGKISDIIIDATFHTIKKYIVKRGNLVKDILSALSQKADLEVSPSQVVSISQDRMIVVDNIALDWSLEKENKQPSVAVPAALTRANEQ